MSNDDYCSSGVALVSFLAGAVVGSVTALLLAPSTGRETREKLSEYGKSLQEKAVSLPDGIKEHTCSLTDQGKELIERGRELINKGTDLVGQGKEYLDDKKKALSAAIDAGKEAMKQEKESIAATLEDEE